MAPIQVTAGIRNIAAGTPMLLQSSFSAGYFAAISSSGRLDWISGIASGAVPNTTSVSTDRAATAATAVTRPGCGTNSAVMMSAIAIQATSAFSP